MAGAYRTYRIVLANDSMKFSNGNSGCALATFHCNRAKMLMNQACSSSKWLQYHGPRRTFPKVKRPTRASDTADSVGRRKSRSYWDRRSQACHGPKLELVENQTGLEAASPSLERPQGVSVKVRVCRCVSCESIQFNTARLRLVCNLVPG